ncbi:MAG TPA: antibiotic biosynthesis monooxygenase [candidate division Zixibacteria bacterium]|nr:antibiotic biosynthesis monooxygenase [candidate division Zixibacteria bacterium]
MYLYVLKWDINPRRSDAYDDWAQKAIKRSIEVPGVLEVRAFRPMAGESQVVVTFEFEDFDSWSLWFNDDHIQQVFNELFAMAANVNRELWEPSPLIPEPINLTGHSPEA